MEDAIFQNENKRLYAIGDIHGRLDLLDRAVAAIHRDVEMYGSNARSRSIKTLHSYGVPS